jgi:DNA replication and repair protein RecF
VHVRHLQVTDFRNWERGDLDLSPGVTVLAGANGAGKTSLAEALDYVATLGSHRAAGDAPLVRHGATRALVRAAVVSGDRELAVEIEINKGKANRARVNRGAPSRARDALGILRTVLFAPSDLALVRGDPAERRRFLDDLLVSRAPRFAGVVSDYERVLRQRSALLKSAAAGGQAVLGTLDAWDAHLAEYGAELTAGRADLLTDLAPHVCEAYREVAPGAPAAGIEYTASLPTAPSAGSRPDPAALAEALRAGLAEVRSRELARGVSLLGPHRDEVTLTLGAAPAVPAKGYASHGESWALALALRLGAYRLLRSDGVEPVLLLDDVFAELDSERRGALAEVAAAAEQAVVTAAVAEDVPAGLSGRRVMIAGGEVADCG